MRIILNQKYGVGSDRYSFQISKSLWWEGIKGGRYPKPVKHFGITMWRAEDIRERVLVKSQVVGAQLVLRMV